MVLGWFVVAAGVDALRLREGRYNRLTVWRFELQNSVSCGFVCLVKSLISASELRGAGDFWIGPHTWAHLSLGTQSSQLHTNATLDQFQQH